MTRLFASRVDQIHLGYPEAESKLKIRPSTRVCVLGNPVAVEASEGSAPDFDWPEGRVLLVFGGSQGALGLNRALLADLEAAEAFGLPDDVSVVWIAGRDHAAEIAQRTSRLPWNDRIRVVPYVEDLGRQLGRISLALCRAGAMSVAELCAAGRPAVLVPLPTSAAGHQVTNARALAEAGAAEMREEGQLTTGELWSLCGEILADEARLASMSEASAARGRPDAAVAIAKELLTLMKPAPNGGEARVPSSPAGEAVS